jgi:hypothetical protein
VNDDDVRGGRERDGDEGHKRSTKSVRLRKWYGWECVTALEILFHVTQRFATLGGTLKAWNCFTLSSIAFLSSSSSDTSCLVFSMLWIGLDWIGL